jgi:2-dehydro-3-deoxy-D-arabinonate dehydratase
MKIFRLIEKGNVKTYAIIGEKVYNLLEDPIIALRNYPRFKLGSSEYTIEDINSFLKNLDKEPKFTKPYEPLEVWGSGISYVIARRRYSEEEQIAKIGEKTIYEKVYDAERPEIFFKATGNRCVGHSEPIAIRRDSEWTLPEPELGVIVGYEGKILGYTIVNDVSARDIESENPLYLPQSKIYKNCCSFGPFIVTQDEVQNPYSLSIKLKIIRNNNIIFEGENSTRNLKRKIEEMIEYLIRDNPIPDGTLLMTGAAVLPSKEFALRAGDIVEISIEKIGTLINPVIKLG